MKQPEVLLGKPRETERPLAVEVGGPNNGLCWPRQKLYLPVSILIPVSNEAEGIESFLAETVETVYRYLPEGSEIHIEEGGSRDGTRDVLVDLNRRWTFLNIDYNNKKEGFAVAAATLYRRAKCPLIFFLDSDGQCVPAEFWKLVPAINDHDFVLGKKKIRHDPLYRRVLSRSFNTTAGVLFGLRFTDINFGYRLVWRDPLLKSLECRRYMQTMLNAELVILASLMDFKICEVPVHHRPRLYGAPQGFNTSKILLEAVAAFYALLLLKRDAHSFVNTMGESHT